MVWYLIRGLVRESAHWGSFPEKLKEAFPDDEFVCPDLPGNGTLNNVNSPSEISEYAHFLHNKFKDCNQKKGVIAISMGGMISFEWCRLYPQDLAAMILINTSLKGVSPTFQRLQPRALSAFVKIILQRKIETRERSILRLVSNQPDKRNLVLKDWVKIQEERPVSTKNALKQLMAAGKYTFKQPEQMPRTLLLASKADRLASYKCSESMGREMNIPVHFHVSAGHDIPLDDPEWLLKEMKKFLDTNL